MVGRRGCRKEGVAWRWRIQERRVGRKNRRTEDERREGGGWKDG
jgi:hypothetical protein